MIRSKKLRESARGEMCTLQLPQCNGDPETTVFCHLNEQFAGKGMGLKADDLGFYGCSDCHREYDSGRILSDHKYYYLLRAVIKTWRRAIEKGVISL